MAWLVMRNATPADVTEPAWMKLNYLIVAGVLAGLAPEYVLRDVPGPRLVALLTPLAELRLLPSAMIEHLRGGDKRAAIGFLLETLGGGLWLIVLAAFTEPRRVLASRIKFALVTAKAAPGRDPWGALLSLLVALSLLISYFVGPGAWHFHKAIFLSAISPILVFFSATVLFGMIGTVAHPSVDGDADGKSND
ncbi:hypothetical protein [Thioclava sp.]|uniref:hypothetical protein n=1 Tax=Thioclava sp. TaxID=1933450 RepID=UPI003AA90EF4